MKSLDYVKDFLEITQNPDCLEMDAWNADYEGFDFVFNGKSFKSRVGRKTPKKAGYFTVAWVKGQNNKNEPYGYDVFPDYLLVWIHDGTKRGVFIFPKDVLRDNRILSSNGIVGKMGFRIYTPWDTGLNPTASKSALWQQKYFFDTTSTKATQALEK